MVGLSAGWDRKYLVGDKLLRHFGVLSCVITIHRHFGHCFGRRGLAIGAAPTLQAQCLSK